MLLLILLVAACRAPFLHQQALGDGTSS